MFLKRLKIFFLILTLCSSIFLIYSWYNNYKFDTNELSPSIIRQIKEKELELKALAYKKLNIKRDFPIVISNKMPAKLYGAATYSKGQIIIYLNKKRFKESLEYMIKDVLPHEYAHAIMFTLNDFSKQDGGHTKRWQNICKSLNGLRCDRFVNHQDIIMGKTIF